MKPSDFQKTIQCQFECKLKKVMVRGLIKKYNKYHMDKLPNITPHSFRHTYWETTGTGTVAQNVSPWPVCGLEPPGTLIRPPSLSLWSLSYKFQIDYA